MTDLPEKGQWPCLFAPSDTTGEKDFEEFFTEGEELNTNRFEHIGIVKSKLEYTESLLDEFEAMIHDMRNKGSWSREDLVALFKKMIPNFQHLEKGKFLDSKM